MAGENMAEEDIDPLITECPKCQTRFRVTETQLQVAAGRVRCGACLTVFQGVEHLLWDSETRFESDSEAQSALDELLSELGGEPVVPADDTAAADDPGPLPDLGVVGNDAISFDAGEDVVEDSAEEDWAEPGHQLYGGHETAETASAEEVLLDRPADQPDAVPTAPEPEASPAPEEPATAEAQAPAADSFFAVPDFAEAPEVPGPGEPFSFGEAPRRRRWWVTAGSVAALVALVAQLLWYQFESWGRDPGIRPVYGVLCKVFGCQLPILEDLDSLLAKNLVVRSHPEVANALLVDAIIVNQASFVQPFPILELRFTSLNGNLVAGRRFQPDEYLAGDLAGATTMPPRTPIRVELGIEDPGDEAVNYFLTFR